MAITGVTNNNNDDKTNGESFGAKADRLNANIPEITTTIPQKEQALNAKRELLADPRCPMKTRMELEQEIATLEKEIQALKMNKSVFGDNVKLNQGN